MLRALFVMVCLQVPSLVAMDPTLSVDLRPNDKSLFKAVGAGNLALVQALMHSANVNVYYPNDGERVGEAGLTPLHLALIREQYPIACVLIEKDASVHAAINSTHYMCGDTPLHIVVKNIFIRLNNNEDMSSMDIEQQLQVLALLLSKGADFGARSVHAVHVARNDTIFHEMGHSWRSDRFSKRCHTGDILGRRVYFAVLRRIFATQTELHPFVLGGARVCDRARYQKSVQEVIQKLEAVVASPNAQGATLLDLVCEKGCRHSFLCDNKEQLFLNPGGFKKVFEALYVNETYPQTQSDNYPDEDVIRRDAKTKGIFW